ncbi:MAG: hypothetical protein AABY13_06010, partial [Nanoarchaeota archaeon]
LHVGMACRTITRGVLIHTRRHDRAPVMRRFVIHTVHQHSSRKSRISGLSESSPEISTQHI